MYISKLIKNTMNEYKLAKAKTVTEFDKAYTKGRSKLLQEVDFLLNGDDEDVSNYIDDNSHPDY